MRISVQLMGMLMATMLAAGNSSPAQAETVLFSDDFDKPFLADSWQIRKDSADMRAIDSGRLAVVSEAGRLSQDTAKNVLVLKDALKEKNADIDLALRVDFQEYGSNWDSRALGGLVLHKSKDEYFILYIVNFMAGYKSDSGPTVFFSKRQGGRSGVPLSVRLMGMKKGPVEYYLRIEKRNYKYTALVSLDGKKWRRVGTFGAFNKTFQPGLFALRGPKAAESIYEFDRFSVTKAD